MWRSHLIGMHFVLLTTISGCTFHAPIPTTIGIDPDACRQQPNVQDAYRTGHYRAPTPQCSPYATTVNTEQLQTLLAQRPETILVDVMGVTRRPEMDEFDSAWLPSRERFNLIGSHWLPNVGYAELTDEMARYYTSQLGRLTHGNYAQPLVIYCIVDCWLSWNAIKRAHELGYESLYWYPDGTDGWAEYGLPLEQSVPIPIYEDKKY